MPTEGIERKGIEVNGTMIYTQDELLNHIRKNRKTKVKAHYLAKDIYAYYKKTSIPELVLPYKKWREILVDLNKAIMNNIIDEAQTIRMGCNIGRLRIRKHKMSFKDVNNLRIDWEKTKKTGVKVYHLNEHRNGYRYRFYWVKGRIEGGTMYSFIPTRENKRRLAKVLKTDLTKDYYE